MKKMVGSIAIAQGDTTIGNMFVLSKGTDTGKGKKKVDGWSEPLVL